VPTPLTDVELAFETFHERTEFCPTVIELGFAVNEAIVGAACTVALQVVVATVDDASVTCRFIVCVPAAAASVCALDVAPLPQRYATGEMPDADDAFHVMFPAPGVPVHDAVNADAELANANNAANASAAAKIEFLLVSIIFNCYY
jgi:hypothetical protein